MEDVKGKILNSACTLFAKNGCKRITMDEVANSIRISKRTLYEHYANKEELIMACINYWQQNIEKEAKMIEAMTDFPIWRMMFMGKLFRTYSHQNQLFFSDLEKYYPDIYKNHLAYPLNLRTKHIEKCLSMAQQQGYFREGVNLEVAAILMANCTYHVLNSTVIPTPMRNVIIGEFMVNYMRGMLTPQATVDFDKNQKEMLAKLGDLQFESLRLENL